MMRAAASLVALSLCAHPAWGAEMKYPTRSIRFVVGFLPGGPATRCAGRRGEDGRRLGAVVVENREGAGGQRERGYRRLGESRRTHDPVGRADRSHRAIIGQKIQFDPDRDFAAVSTLGGSMSI